jgi:hypothetical protein
MQITNISIPAREYTQDILGIYGQNVLDFEFEDDVTNRAASAIHKFGESSEKFNVIVETLDVDEIVLDRISFIGCSISSMQHSNPLNYAGYSNNDHLRFSVDPRWIVGNLVDDIPGGENLIKLLTTFFRNLSINVDVPTDKPTNAVSRRVVIEFDSRVDEFLKQVKS